jgi:hypothetical protein
MTRDSKRVASHRNRYAAPRNDLHPIVAAKAARQKALQATEPEATKPRVPDSRSIRTA